MSYAIMIVMAFFVFGFLSFLIAGRERFQGEKRVRRLTQSLLKRIEDERKQVSFDLHEVVVQDLASIKMQCQNLLEDIRSGRGAPEETVSTLVNELGELIGVTRGITGTLKPRRLDHFGLTGTIKALCNDLSASSDLDVRFHSVGLEAIEIDYDTEINIYRIAQELLRYIRKYSRAERTSVKLISSSPYLYLRISDDGNGINPFKQRVELRTAPEEQLRLITVEERVRMLEGTITIQAVPGRGTEFKIGIPIEQSSKGSTDETPGSEER
jgi:signal transduction histidine kinase